MEIIGEDEAYNLDPETIYFITHLLNQNNLRKIRNEILFRHYHKDLNYIINNLMKRNIIIEPDPILRKNAHQ